MRKAFILCQKKLTNVHYTSLALEDARTAVKLPVTMLMAWKHWDQVQDQDQQVTDIIAWLKEESQAQDYLVLQGDPGPVAKLQEAGIAMALIPLTPAWDPDTLTESVGGKVLPVE